MIVRVLGEGQYEVPDALLRQLDEIDNAAVAAIERGDEEALRARLAELHRTVETAGRRLEDASLTASDLIVPPTDLSLEEARRLFSAEGLIPDLPTDD